MGKELAFALINPYTIAKSRTGGVIGRFISRTGLELVAARMFGPSREWTERCADLRRPDPETDGSVRGLLADYVTRCYAPETASGRKRRIMMLLFEGEDAVEKIRKAAGPIRHGSESADTIRGTFGDFILDEKGGVRYFEPAVLIGSSAAAVRSVLTLWSEYAQKDGGLIEDAADLSTKGDLQETLVLIKPDNFRFPSSRPGNINELFSGSGLRIIGAKIHRMSVAEAEEFYGPVRNVLREKLKGKTAERAARVLAAELGFEMPPEVIAILGDSVGPLYGDNQFFQIIKFMTGYWTPDCSSGDKKKPGKERCLALIYAGPKAVDKIRGILGPTDPSKAQPGSVRREFGQDIMVNAAHASDSPENAKREMKIVKVDQDTISEWAKKYYG